MSRFLTDLRAFAGGLATSVLANTTGLGLEEASVLLTGFLLSGSTEGPPPTADQHREVQRWLRRLYRNNIEQDQLLATSLNLSTDANSRLKDVGRTLREMLFEHKQAIELIRGISRQQIAQGDFVAASHSQTIRLLENLASAASPHTQVVDALEQLEENLPLAEAQMVAEHIYDILKDIHADYFGIFSDLRARLSTTRLDYRLCQWFEQRRRETIVERIEVQQLLGSAPLLEGQPLAPGVSQFQAAVRRYFGLQDGKSRSAQLGHSALESLQAKAPAPPEGMLPAEHPLQAVDSLAHALEEQATTGDQLATEDLRRELLIQAEQHCKELDVRINDIVKAYLAMK